MRDVGELIAIAERHTMQTSDLSENHLKIVIEESYIPYIPDPWNGVLALAESQNLSETISRDYRLDEWTPDKRRNRLNLSTDGIGVGPWDAERRTMKLMMKAFHVGWNLDEIAVSNAVPWSCRDSRGRNVNPTDDMQRRAIQYWLEMILAFGDRLETIITFGAIARSVISEAKDRLKWDGQVFPLRFPSPRVANQCISMFNAEDLRRRYQEELSVACAAVARKPSDWEVLLACHAASIGRGFRADRTGEQQPG